MQDLKERDQQSFLRERGGEIVAAGSQADEAARGRRAAVWPRGLVKSGLEEISMSEAPIV
ncbi:hypothetical protein PI126_g11228 [Phytophthora idaei]|nr:hypothetical protein PI126_g11228 [Phytophthora idaei]